jgi:protein O-mannosyl-transferase
MALLQSILERATTGRRAVIVAAVLIAIVTVAVYLPVTQATFLNYDDDAYVTNNVHIIRWRGWENIAWAFTSIEATHWHPLTWLSHMADAQFFGARPGLHHMTALALHVASTVLLLVALRRMTGRLWPSAMVAGLFALHPLHVESVAWIAERKDVLSTFFIMLALVAYTHYARRPGFGRYAAVLVLFAMGLMSKSMVVTFPCLLLLLDYWPLKRMIAECRMQNAECKTQKNGEKAVTPSGSSGGVRNSAFCNLQSAIRRSAIVRLVLEKLPLLALSAATAVVAMMAMRQAGMMPDTAELSIGGRLANVALSYVTYMGKMLWPLNLAVFYPYRHNPETGDVVMAVGILAAITAVALWQVRRRPYLAVGWFWYLVALTPVIGIVQVGGQSMDDRYTYVPLVGLFIMIVWGVADLAKGWRLRRVALPALALAALAACAGLTARQVTFWKDTEAVAQHNLDVVSGSALVHVNLGEVYARQKRYDEALEQYQLAIACDPAYFMVYVDLGALLYEMGRLDESSAYCRRAIELKPDREEAYNTLGQVFVKEAATQSDPARTRLLNQALRAYSKAMELSPGWGDPYTHLGVALDLLGRTDEAIAANLQAMELKPFYTVPHVNLGLIYLRHGRLAEAAAEMRTALRIHPYDAPAHLGLGRVLMQQQELAAAAQEFQRALAIDPNLEEARANLVRLRGGTR